jgi:hypothetical protein
MEEPPQQNRHRHQQQSKSLVAPVNPQLFRAPRLLIHLFEVRLDTRLHHSGPL